MTMKSVALAASTLILGTAAAHAGGYVPPVVETAPAPVVIETPVGSWQGGYAGLTLGYAFSGKDEVGFGGAGLTDSLGELDLNGANAGVRIGYRWQRGNWVIGPELGIEGGDIKDSFSSEGYDVESQIKHMIALRLKTGYAMDNGMLVYGIAGVGRAKVDYSIIGAAAELDDSFSKTGYIVGLGMEKQINEKWSVTGEYEYANFGSENLSNGVNDTNATAKYNNVKLGVNFRF